MLILGTSEKKGICFIETKNLDGETNLKRKVCPTPLNFYYSNDEEKVKKNPNNFISLNLIKFYLFC